jgi:hypothetical protein
VIFLFLTYTLASLLIHIGGSSAFAGHASLGPQAAQPVSALSRLAGLISPFTVLDGVREWLGGTSPGQVPHPGGYGPAYGVMLLVYLGIGAGGLILRYRRVGVA